MSTSSGHWYGYGLSSYELDKIPNDKIAAFIQKRPQLFKEWWDYIIEDGADLPSFEEASLEQIYKEFSSYIDKDEMFDESIFICIHEALSNETDLYFDYASFEGEVGIIFPQMMPWDMSEQEKALSLEGLQKIFQPFLCELGIPDTKIDFVDIEWWG